MLKLKFYQFDENFPKNLSIPEKYTKNVSALKPQIITDTIFRT